MTGFEIGLLEWLGGRVGRATDVPLGIGDDMAVVMVGGRQVLLGCDMLLDGVHFDSTRHSMEAIGRKLLACSLSDCAAMAARPRSVTVSIAAPRDMGTEKIKQLFEGLLALAEEFEVHLVGGDTTRWNHPLAIDLCLLAEPWEGIEPVTRGGAKVGDRLYVTGPLGGSITGKHLTFTPRVREAQALAKALGNDLHAMMDISDGLSLDLWRLCRASGLGAMLFESGIDLATSDAARDLAKQDGRKPLDHALTDGEDFELLLAVVPSAMAVEGLVQVGEVTQADLKLKRVAGHVEALEPRGYIH